jgi:hypothetical protein
MNGGDGGMTKYAGEGSVTARGRYGGGRYKELLSGASG